MEALGQPSWFGQYRLTSRIATGGMAEVYLGRHISPDGRFGPLVALKRLLPHLVKDAQIVRMFLNEARITAQIDHPNVVRVIDLGQESGEPYICMELLDGYTLAELRRRTADEGRRMPLGITLRVLADACRGLDAAHAAKDEEGKPLGLVHRDFTPDNIHVGATGEVKVIDFGVAKTASWGSGTEPGTLKGKFFYMSPEMILARPLDHRADLFAAGVMLYEELCGRRPFTGKSVDEVVLRIAEGMPRPPRAFDPSVPEALEVICLKALEREPDRRFPSLQEFIHAIENVGGLATVATREDVAAFLNTNFPPERDTKRQTLRQARAADPSEPGVIAGGAAVQRPLPPPAHADDSPLPPEKPTVPHGSGTPPPSAVLSPTVPYAKTPMPVMMNNPTVPYAKTPMPQQVATMLYGGQAAEKAQDALGETGPLSSTDINPAMQVDTGQVALSSEPSLRKVVEPRTLPPTADELPKKSKAPMIVGGVVLLGLVGAGAIFLRSALSGTPPAAALLQAETAKPEDRAKMLSGIGKNEAATFDQLDRAAKLLEEARAWDAVLELADAWTRRDPKDIRAHLYTATAAARLRKGKRAEAAIAAAQEIDPKDVRADLAMADLREAQGDMSSVIEALGRATRRKPDDAALKLRYAVLLSQAGRVDDAAPLLEPLAKAGDGRAAAELAFVELRRKKTGEAEALLKKAVKKDPSVMELHYYLGAVLYQKGEIPQARTAYLEADKLAGADTRPLAALCEIDTAQSRPELDETKKRISERFPQEAATLLAKCASTPVAPKE